MLEEIGMKADRTRFTLDVRIDKWSQIAIVAFGVLSQQQGPHTKRIHELPVVDTVQERSVWQVKRQTACL